MVRETYLKNKGKLATQMGTQIHATDNYRRVVELIRDGAIGDRQGGAASGAAARPKAAATCRRGRPVPRTSTGTSGSARRPCTPTIPDYLGSCLAWNRFWDFGSGQIGDMGSHMMDLAYWALDLRFPTTCEAQGTPLHPDTCPRWLTAEWDHPANDWRPAVKVYWYDGGKKPGMPIPDLQPRRSSFEGHPLHGRQGLPPGRLRLPHRGAARAT